MTTYVIVASGQSLNDYDLGYIHSAKELGAIDGVIAVSNAGIDKCPWADALVSHDSAWWMAYPESVNFKGRKYSSRGYRTTHGFDPVKYGFGQGLNSGLMAMYVAKEIYKATKLILLGFDMHGTHYFGKHEAKVNNRQLNNTTPEKFQAHIKQFNKFSGCEVYNATPNSALKVFPLVQLSDIL